MILDEARQVLETEAEQILLVSKRLGEDFSTMAEWIFQAQGGKDTEAKQDEEHAGTRGRVIIAGIGKSGLVGRKIVATLNSTGTPSLFLHPVEAMHGDLGMVGKKDVFLALSNSGETDELNVLIPSIKAMGCPVVALTGNPGSTLGRLSDVAVNVGVEKEACPLGLAPTASTTALLAVGDALAVVLMDKRKFKSRDFKKFHPGGALGQRLSAFVADLMVKGDQVPLVDQDSSMDETIRLMDRFDLGAALVTRDGDVLTGIITDGDLRRLLLDGKTIAGNRARDAMTPEPKTLFAGQLTSEALNLMEKHLITVLPVVDENKRVQGILHLHDILGKGTVRFNGR